jgi:hypothetical protein
MPSTFAGLNPIEGNSELLFYKSAGRLIEAGRKMERPWSIAELRLGSDDFAWLSSWALGLSGSIVRTYLANRHQTSKFGEIKVSYASALGLMLIAFASEAARRDATDGSLWPSVRRDSSGGPRFSQGADKALFNSNDYPVDEFRKAVRLAVKVFGLRHAFDEAKGKHRYYLTIFLQFGFSREDAHRRLALWLAGHPSQEAIRNLREGRQKSTSFRLFWNRLRLGNSRWISQDDLRRSLEKSPWTCAEWIEDLIEASKRERVCCTAATDRETLFKSTVQLLSEPRFTWKLPAPPCYTTRLQGLSDLALSEAEYELQVAGSRRLGIVEDEDGNYRSTSSEEIDLPGNSTSVTAELLNANEEIIWTDVLDCRDPSALFTAYKLPSGSRMAEMGLFDPQGTYALVVPHGFEVEPKRDYRAIPGSNLTAHLIEPGQISETRITKDGLPFWQPTIPGRPPKRESDASRKINAEIRSLPMAGPYSVLPRLQVQVRHPADITIHQARILDQDYPETRNGRMTCFGPFSAPVELLVYPGDLDSPPGTVDILLRIENGDRLELVRKRANYNGHGAAIRRGENWDAIPASGLPFLTIEDAETHLFHIVPPHKQAAQASFHGSRYIPIEAWSVLEMDRAVGGIGRRSTIRGLQGYGAPLVVRCGSGYHSESVTLAESVTDPGDIREVCAPTESEDGLRSVRIHLTHHVEIEPGRHRVLWWDRSGKSVWLEPSPVCLDGALPRDDWWTVTLPEWAGEYRALGVAYQGMRLGSWWSRGWADGLNELDAQGLAEILPWLKLPILDPRVQPAIDRFVDSNFGVWLFDPPSSELFQQERNNVAWREVVRSLYCDRPVSHEQAGRLVELAEGKGRWPQLAKILCEIHPLLLVRTMQAYIGDGTLGQKRDALALIGHIHETLGEKNQTKEDRERERPPGFNVLARESTSSRPRQDSALEKSVSLMLEHRPDLRYAFCRECLKVLASRLD